MPAAQRRGFVRRQLCVRGPFRSTDGGIRWEPFSIINDDPLFRTWMGTVQDGTPDGPKLHSIIVDPRDGEHLYIGMSGGGVHETKDGGRTWQRLDEGLPRSQAWWTVTRQCMAADAQDPLALYVGNSGGEVRLRPGGLPRASLVGAQTFATGTHAAGGGSPRAARRRGKSMSVQKCQLTR